MLSTAFSEVVLQTCGPGSMFRANIAPIIASSTAKCRKVLVPNMSIRSSSAHSMTGRVVNTTTSHNKLHTLTKPDTPRKNPSTSVSFPEVGFL